jgi:Pectate lyase superfamily protein
MSGLIVRKTLETVSVKGWPYLAKGDGLTVDTLAMQAALNSGAKRVLIPAGVYVSAPLSVPTGVQVFGEGWASVLKLTAGANAPVLTVSGNGVCIKDLKIDGTGDSQTHGGGDAGILFTAASTDCRIENVWCDKVSDWGFQIYGDGHILKDCIATDIRGATSGSAVRAGFLVGDAIGGVARNILLSGCISRNHTVPFTDGFIVEDGGSPGTQMVNNITMDGCIARNLSYIGIKPKADNMTLTACHASNCGFHGFQTQNAPQNLMFIGCSADTNGWAGYYLNTTSAVVQRGLCMVGCTARNNGQDVAGGGTVYGFAFENTAGSVCDGALITGCQAYDSQGVATQLRGFSFGTSGSYTNVAMTSCYARGCTVDMFQGASLDLATFTKSGNVGLNGASNSLKFTWPTHVQKLGFWINTLTASQGTTNLFSNGTNNRGYLMSGSGSVRRLSVRGSVPTTAGNATFQLRINGVIQGSVAVQLNATNPTFADVVQNIRAVPFVAGDMITVTCSTDAAFLPINTNVDAAVEVLEQ